MNAEFLLRHYEKIADAPAAIARLRRFVLDLAVRGQLVPQDARDEPAAELLKRISKDKARLVKTGEIKKAEAVADLTKSVRAFQAPLGWIITNLQSICNSVTDGDHLPPPKAETGVPFLVIGNVRSQQINFEGSRFVHQSYYDALDPIRRPRSGDLLYTLVGSYGIPVIVRDDRSFCVQRHIGILRPSALLDVNFLARTMDSGMAFDQATACATGIAQKTVPLSGLRKMLLPLPPLAEQHRIVAKVDELMALCDRLEAARAEREAARDRLAAASLARLNTPDPEHFQDHARFALNTLPAVTTRPDQIKQLRQTILNLAVRGKLVRHDPKDEPASDLLARIFALPWTKKRKPSDLTPDNDALAEAFLLPKGWQWASVDAIVRPNETVTYGILKPEWVSDGVPTVRVTEMKTGKIDVASLPKCDRVRAEKFKKTTLVSGDLLVSKDGTIGKTAFVPPELEGGNITQHVLRFPICDLLNSKYVRLTIDAPFCQAWMAGETKGVALQGVNVGDFRRMPIALPPLAEQHRIVAKVDAMMSLCNQLESSLEVGATIRSRLLNALLAEALTPAAIRELEAAE